MRCGLFDGTGDLINGGGEVAIGHFDDRFTRLLYPVQDLLVFDFEFGISLCFFTDDLTEVLYSRE